MRYREFLVTPPLDRWVECVWMAESSSKASPGHAFDTIVPDGCPELILQLGDRFESVAGDGPALQPSAFLLGALSGPLRIRPRGRIHTVGVRFRPGGLATFLDLPLHELTDRAVPLDELFGGAARTLAERVAAARHPVQVVRVVEGFLGSRLAPRASAGEKADALVGALIRSRGRATVESLARGAGVSLRQIERAFRREVGLSPKRLARIVRLQEVLRRLGHGRGRWVDVALDCGYADQAHLTREFKELAGDSPARWIGGDGNELARQFTARERLDAFFRH